MRGKGMQSVAAGCLYLACRQENNPRTFREITAVLPPNVQKRDIGRCFKDIVQVGGEGSEEGGGPKTRGRGGREQGGVVQKRSTCSASTTLHAGWCGEC